MLSFPTATEMFQFAAFALPVLCIQTGVTIRWGCPIRRSEDHSLVTGSSRLIAGSRVLHRLSMPRHPSCALSVLAMPTWPPLGTGACHVGLCGSDIRLASNCSREPATQYSRSFSVQFNLALPVAARLRPKPAAAHVSGARRPTLHLSKSPNRLWRMGTGNGTDIRHAVKGVECLLRRIFCRFDYGKVQAHYCLKNKPGRASARPG